MNYRLQIFRWQLLHDTLNERRSKIDLKKGKGTIYLWDIGYIHQAYNDEMIDKIEEEQKRLALGIRPLYPMKKQIKAKNDKETFEEAFDEMIKNNEILKYEIKHEKPFFPSDEGDVY